MLPVQELRHHYCLVIYTDIYTEYAYRFIFSLYCYLFTNTTKFITLYGIRVFLIMYK